MTTIYFVCHGNTCRSPMGAEIFRQAIKSRANERILVDCFGTEPYYPDDSEVKRLRETAVAEVMGVFDELSDHTPKGIEEVDLKSYDTVVMLDLEDASTLEDQIAATGARPRLIVWDVEDPFKKHPQKYVESAQVMRAAIERNFHLLSDTSWCREE